MSFSGPTTAMIRHINERHHAEKKAFEDESMRNPFDLNDMEEIESRATKVLIRLVVHIFFTVEPSHYCRSIASSNIPFRYASSPLFRQFCHTIAPKFKVPGAKKVKKGLIACAQEYTSFVKRKLKDVHQFVLVTDGFSDLSSNKSFYSAHLIYVDEFFNKNTQFAGIQYVKKGTADNVSLAVSAVLKSVGKSLLDCHSTVTDGGANVKAFSGANLLPNSHCGCHIIHLIFGDFEKSSKPIKILLMHARKVTGVFARQANLREEIRMKTTDPSPLPKPACITRWAHQFLILRQYSKHYRAISAVTGMLLRTQQIPVLEEVVELMEPLFVALKKVSSFVLF